MKNLLAIRDIILMNCVFGRRSDTAYLGCDHGIYYGFKVTVLITNIILL